MWHPLVKISLRRCHAQTVEKGASSHKTNYIDTFSKILILERHLNHCIGSKLTAIFLNGRILPTGGVASGRVWPAACAAGLFIVGIPYTHVIHINSYDALLTSPIEDTLIFPTAGILKFIWPCKIDWQPIFPKMQRTSSLVAKLLFVRPLICQICDSSPQYFSNVTFGKSLAYQMRKE